MAFGFHPGKKNKVRKESGRDTSKNNLFSSSPQSEYPFKAGIHLEAVFPPLNVGLMRISRSRFKQSKNPMLKTKIYVLR